MESLIEYSRMKYKGYTSGLDTKTKSEISFIIVKFSTLHMRVICHKQTIYTYYPLQYPLPVHTYEIGLHMHHELHCRNKRTSVTAYVTVCMGLATSDHSQTSCRIAGLAKKNGDGEP